MKKYTHSELVELCSSFQFQRIYVNGQYHFQIRDAKGDILLKERLIPICDALLSFMREHASSEGLECVWQCVFADFTREVLKQWLLVLIKDFVTFFVLECDSRRDVLRPLLYKLIVEFNRSAPDSFVNIKHTTLTVDVRTVFDRGNHVVGYVWLANPTTLYQSYASVRTAVCDFYKGLYDADAVILNLL